LLTFVFRLLVLSLIGIHVCLALPQHSSPKNVLSPTNIQHKLPLYFEDNVGQHDDAFHFVAKTAFSQFAFADNKVVIRLKGKDSTIDKQFSLVFQGANKSALVTGSHKSTYQVNYFRGAKSQWRENVATYSEIIYQDIYPGIDLKFYFNRARLEYDFIVSAGVDPAIIRFKYENINDISITENSVLDISIDNGLVRQHAPVIYQVVDGEKKKVAGQYVRSDTGFRFELADYDRNKTLVIDPVIEFSSYFGGNWEDSASSIAVDSAGYIFLAGATAAQARITNNNMMTLENTALSSAVTGLGLGPEFASGSQLDLIANQKITIVDGAEQREVYQYACDYRYAGFFGRDSMVTDYDAFISKFDSNYKLMYTTYYGGCRNDGIRDLVIDKDEIYVAGFTLSDNIPVQSGFRSSLSASRFGSAPVQADAFYAKFSNDGSLIYSSYFGGDGRDGARAIAVDSDGALYITGYTHSKNLTSCSATEANVIGCKSIGGVELTTEFEGQPEDSLYADAFVAKISPAGDALGFVTYFGGSLDDWGQDIVVREDIADPTLNGIYISGNTSSPDLLAPGSGYSLLNYRANVDKCSRITDSPDSTTPNAGDHFCEDVFIAKLSMDAQQLYFSTYIGGKMDDNVSDMEIDHLGNIYLVGTSRSQGARFQLPTLLPPIPDPDTRTDAEKIQYAEDNALLVTLVKERFPLYKNINKLGFVTNSNTSMAFLSVFNATADQLILSSFIGGDDEDAGLAIELNDDINSNDIGVYVGGHTQSNNFYTLSAFQSSASRSELFLVKLTLFMDKFSTVYDTPDCNQTRCDLYDIQYSTLIGGEELDALKDLYYRPFDGSLFIAGNTYSRLFPVTADAVKSEITEVKIKDYNPATRALELEAGYYPSDLFFMKLSDVATSTDWIMDVSMTNTKTIRKGDTINYEMVISRNPISPAIDATSMRININFPYLASNETITQYASVDNVEQCVMEYKQIYCVVGDLAENETKTINIRLAPRVSGSFPVTFSLLNRVSDSDMSNNSKQIVTDVGAVPSNGAMAFWFLVSLIFVRKITQIFSIFLNHRVLIT